MTDDMRRSWLIQRLNRPHRSTILGRDNPFAFGGGLRNGGLGNEAMDLLREVFSFDYMGAAEFEFGAVPKALNGIAKDHKRLVAHELTIELSTLAEDWQDKTRYEGEATVFVICRKAHVAEVENRVRTWASEGYRSELKETTRLEDSLRPVRKEWNRTDGWLELDNGFFFFTDRTMFEGVADLFGVKVARVSA